MVRCGFVRVAACAAAIAGAAIACGESNEEAPSHVFDASPSGTSPGAPDADVTTATTATEGGDTAEAARPNDAATARRPIVFVHGINGSLANFAVMIDSLAAHGWPKSSLVARTLPDPAWGCNADNAKTIASWVAELMKQTGASQVDLVVHSMGGLSSRHFMKHLGGAALVRTYVSFGSMHHGLGPSCFSPLDICVWKELCQSGPFVADLDAPPATPGPARWVSIFSTDDGTVPVATSKLVAAPGVVVENVQFAGIPHSGAGGLLESPLTLAELERALLD